MRYDPVMVIATRLSVGQFLEMPRIEERRLELIDGEVYEKPVPTFDHGSLQIEIGHMLAKYGRASSEARTLIPGSGFGRDSAVLPDVCFFRRESARERGHVTKPPHVAVEILSPGQSLLEMTAKARIYLDFGVESVWLVDPDGRTVEVFEAGERRTLAGADTLSSPSVPGLSIQVGALFETLDN